MHGTYLAQADSHTLLGSLYDSVLAETGFQGFIAIFCRTFELKSAAILVRHVHTLEAKSLWQIGVDESWMESYALEYASEDLLAQHMATSPIAAFYASNLDIGNPERFPETRFYREWIVPQGIAYAAGSVVLHEGEWMTEFFLQRSPEQRPFSRVDLERFNQLIPHVQRAIQMRQRFIDLRLGQSLLGSVLDLLVMPTVLFDESGCVAHANAPANAVMKRREQYWENAGHFVCSTSAMTRLVNLEVSKAVRISRGEALAFHGVVMLGRPDNVPLILMITPMRLVGTMHRQGAALLFVFDPQATPSVTAQVVQRLFGLSEAEAELAVALCRGLTLEDAANERGISIHTTRSQLKSIFNKTGTKRQADLLSLLLTSPAFFLSNMQQ